MTESATHKCKYITWLDLHMTRKMYYVSSNELLISHASTAYLEERKRKLILERRKSNHIKEKDRSST